MSRVQIPAFPPAFRKLAWSNLSAQAAEQVALAAAPMLAVLSLGADVGETGLLAAAQSLPFLLLSLPAGLLADRMARRRLMLAAEWLRAIALTCLPLLLWAGYLSLPLLMLIGALTATGTVVYSVTAPSLVPALVPRAGLAAANTRLELARSLAFAGGPALAGALVGLAGGGTAFILAAMLSALAAILLGGLSEPPRPAAPPRRIVADLVEGVRFVGSHRLLLPIMATGVAWNISWFVLQAAYVPFAVTRLGLNAAELGLTLSGYGAGMVVGAIAAPWIARRMRFGLLIATGPLTSVFAAWILVMSPNLQSMGLHGIAVPLTGFFLFGIGPILWTIGQTTLRQAVTPDAMMGRVSALTMMATAGARPVGAALGGLVGSWLGLDAAILVAAIGFVVQFAIIATSPVPRLTHLPELPA